MHELEIFDDGSTAFASARQDAWHRLGTVTRDCMTADEVLDTARLAGWNVRKLPLTAHEFDEHGVDTVEIPDRFATVRTHPVNGRLDYLGTVGNDYEVRQNESMAEILNMIVDESGAHFETAGSLRGGRHTFVSMKLPETMTVGGVDPVDVYLTAMNSHDGSSAFRVLVTPIRVVCANTQAAALREAQAAHSIRHTKGNNTIAIETLRSKLDLMFAYCGEFERQAERMINEPLSQVHYREVIDQIWPTEPNPRPRTRANATERTNTLLGLFDNAATQDKIRGTRWAGYQAIVEYLDHYSPAKDQATRAHRVLTSDTVTNRKNHAYQLLAV